MSVVGQTRRFRDVRAMSGLPQTADISGHGRHFAFGPKAVMILRWMNRRAGGDKRENRSDLEAATAGIPDV
jgi:hypothetical protein